MTPPPSFGPVMTRRTACAFGAGLSAVALSGVAPLGATTIARGDIHVVIRDERRPESVRFSAVLAEKGARVLDVTSGLTRLWRDDLLPLWSMEGRRIAGLTERGVWECLAEQARSHGRRSQLVAHHGIAPDGSGSVTHFARAPQDIAQRTALLDACGAQWPNFMAQLALHCPAGRRQAISQNGGKAMNVDPGLVSWIIG